ncbi:beta-ketoacyl synthase N-terminal-like domain-containing protein [Brevibacillus fortis]|uniref:beta-ketoacyl synthase N-terminal-like domain-containing protein n=1 Tax=Brevibacillus fortis TaxID=2126352 RepID=UPI002E201132|nr:beta-ketoacyl synthase N-terminal-like domain-containing protein [Brevibacillus fortis]
MSKPLGLNRVKLNKQQTDAHSIESKPNQHDIAVIGAACRFGSAENPADFWRLLQAGQDCVRELPKERQNDLIPLLLAKGLTMEQIQFREAAYLNEIDKFDPQFFGLSPKEASQMDPNQRLFLLTCWEAIEDAGYGGTMLAGSRTGVYLGFSSDFGEEYRRMIRELEPEALSTSIIGNMKSVIASRISYMLDLKGPSMLVDTSCSSSLMAVHLACQAIRRGECEMALAGGVKLILLSLQDGSNDLGILSQSGRTRPFDNDSDGTGVGEGVGAVLLKPLTKALVDGDSIYAVIKGSAANQDGHSFGLTAPNSLAQAEVIQQAWKDAQIDPETLSYIEVHSIGTKLGDPMEMDGLERAFRPYTNRRQFCGIGSVKTNIGHTDHVAGMAGLFKVILSLKQKQIPPHLHFQRANRMIPFEQSPIYIHDKLTEWEPEQSVRRAGISSFGMSGTNVHLVVEEAPGFIQPPKQDEGFQAIALSAKSKESLSNLLLRFQNWTRKPVEELPTLESLSFTANTGRSHYGYRLLLICRDMDDFSAKINKLCASDWTTLSEPDIFFGWHKVISHEKADREPGILTEAEQQAMNKATSALLQKLLLAQNKELSDLKELGELYVSGADVRWSSLYTFKKPRRVHLPVYPFERKRCWLDIASLHSRGEDARREKDNDAPQKSADAKLPNVVVRGRKHDTYTVLEQELAHIWGYVLGLEEIDVYDSFYELGGDSIIAIRVISEISKRVNREVEVKDLLTHLTISEFAAFLDSARHEEEQVAIAEAAVTATAAQIVHQRNTKSAHGTQIKRSTYADVSHLSWRQWNCYDRGLALLMEEQDAHLIPYFKLFLGLKRGYQLDTEGYPYSYREHAEVMGYLSDEEMLYKFGYRVNLVPVARLDELHESIIRQLDQGKPVMVAFDEYYTFYTPQYQKEHTDHLTVITGYDHDKQVYTIINHNHLTRGQAQRIQYDKFSTTYQTLEEIYANIEPHSRLIMVLDRVTDDEASLRYSAEQELLRLLKAIESKQEVGRELTLLLSLTEQPDTYFDQANLNELYVQLGGKELWMETLLDGYIPQADQSVRELAEDILQTSNNVVNRYALSLYKEKMLKRSDMEAAVDKLRSLTSQFLQQVFALRERDSDIR